MTVARQADSLTEEQVSEFKEAFSLFVCFPSLFSVSRVASPAYLVAGTGTEILDLTNLIFPATGQRWRWLVHTDTSNPHSRPHIHTIRAARPSNAEHRKLGNLLAHATAGATAAAACQRCGAERLNGY